MKQISTFLFIACAFSVSAQDQCNIPGSINIEAYSYAYSPQNVTVVVGTTVAWTNTNGYHDVNGTTNTITGASFNNPVDFYIDPVFASSEAVCIGSFTFTQPGVYSYDCSIGNHAINGMVGTITVVDASGCTDSAASNYDANASSDDGSCLYTAQYVNSQYNTGYAEGAASVECPELSCLGDLDGDNVVAVSDLLTLLTVFGDTCE
jgi:plastocyanin